MIVAGLAVILFYFFYHPPDFKLLHKNSRMEQLRRMDFVGLILFSGGLAVFLIGLAWGSGTYPWKSAHVIATIVVGAVTLIAFVLYGMLVCQRDKA